MTCTKIKGGIICRMSDDYRLRLGDGRYIFMSWHHYCGPEFYHDRAQRRLVVNWWEDDQIMAAVDWFQDRGKRA